MAVKVQPQNKAMSERINFMLKYIKDNACFTDANHTKLDVYEGNLLPYVKDVMKKSLSENYFKQIEHRIMPINVLTRITDKLAKVYISPPIRKSDTNQEFIDEMSDDISIDLVMSIADEYSHLFKCYALEPFLDEGCPQVRVLPADRFIVIGADKKNPLKVTTFIKFMGLVGKQPLYYAYTDTEFIPFTADGKIYSPALEGNDGVNPFGVIPFVYGNRSKLDIVPTQDSDIMQLTLMIPILLSDLAGAIMFNCFSVIYGIDLKIDSIVKSPNAFWNFKTDSKNSETKPQIGTIKSDVDIDKVMAFIKQSFAFWLETKGVRIGSLNNLDAGNAASGIAKIIDEMDVYEIKKQQINYFKKEEAELWELLAIMNNVWIETEENYEGTKVPDDFEPTIVFDEPRPEIPRATEFETIDKEYKGGYMTSKDAIQSLYPDLDEDEVIERAAYLDAVTGRTTTIVEDAEGAASGTGQNEDQNTASVQPEDSEVNS